MTLAPWPIAYEPHLTRARTAGLCHQEPSSTEGALLLWAVTHYNQTRARRLAWLAGLGGGSGDLYRAIGAALLADEGAVQDAVRTLERLKCVENSEVDSTA